MSAIHAAFPRYNLTRVFTLRNLLADDTLTEFTGFTPTGDSFDEMVEKICATLGRVQRQIIWDSVRNVAGTLLMADDIYRMSWRLAGNLVRLRDGTSVPPWHVQQEKEWVPAQVVAYRPAESRRGRPGGDFTIRVLAGTACPIRITKFFTVGFARQTALRLGYTRLRGKSPLGHISELVNMRLWIQLDPDFCRIGSPGFDHVGCTAGLKKWNMEIIKKRFRRGWPCPHDFDHYCHECPIGYRECPAATHQETVSDGRRTTKVQEGDQWKS